MSAAFDKARAFTLSPDVEGGNSNRATDRGGITSRGVTQPTYNAWRALHGLPLQSVYMMSDDEERAIYYENFWMPCRCEELGSPLGAAVFDMAVNSGPWNAKLALQGALRVRQDGQIGPVTLAAAQAAPDALLRFLRARGALVRDDLVAHPSDIANLDGWINRLLNFQDQALKGAFA